MTCHAERFEPLAHMLTDRGIAVAALDLRGHGHNAHPMKCASFASENWKPGDSFGWKEQLREIDEFVDLMQARFPEARLFLLGFSLGSFLIRDYLLEYPDRHHIGTILMGTGDQPALVLKIIQAILRLQMRKIGPGECSDLVRNLSFASYNNKFKPNQTRADWLTSNASAVENYINDPLCQADVGVDLLYEMIAAMERTGNMKNISKDSPSHMVPTLILAGEQDAVGNMGVGVKTLKKKLEKAGVEDVTLCLYPNARHDLLHEQPEIVEQVVDQLQQWVCAHCPQPPVM